MPTVADIIRGAKTGDRFVDAGNRTWIAKSTPAGPELARHEHGQHGWVSAHTAALIEIPGLRPVK